MTEQRGINSVHKALIDEGDDMNSAVDCGHGVPHNLECGACGPMEDVCTLEDTLRERGARYGDFFDHAAIAQDLQNVLRYSVYGGGKPCWGKLSPIQKQALTVIADKIARILSGDPNYKDSWHDIQGYAKLVEGRLP